MNENIIAIAVGALLAAAVAGVAVAPAPRIVRHDVVICIEREADTVEQNAAKLLQQRLTETGQVRAEIVTEGGAAPSDKRALVVLLGIPAHHAEIARDFQRLRIAPLTQLAPGPEGFLLRSLPEDDRLTVLAAGIDDRGCVYAVGELLRQALVRKGGVVFPDTVNVRTAPAFEVRGTAINQSGVMLTKGRARKWTLAEREHAIADIFLAGANTIQTGGDDPAYGYIKSLGMKTLVHYDANAGSGPPEWQAKESIGRTGYLCPSVPAARAALLQQCDANFRNSPDYDYVRLVGGDGGGCECDNCWPYGHVFITLCADEAAIIHKYHPKTQIFITNQKFSNESDEAVFKYLQEKPHKWLRAFCYGPGSDAMSWQPGQRQDHRMDLFRYPGYGPPARYIQEILHQLPPQQDVVFYDEITHWRYSEFGFAQAAPRADKNGDLPPHWGHFMYERMPERYLTQVYDRLSFFAWPRFYYRMFNETVRYGIGDCTHSSGTQDQFNQWMWQRLLWNPHRSLDGIVDEYTRYWFGPEAAPLMTKAIFLLEKNIHDDPKQPLPQKPGIPEYFRLVTEAGKRMPAYMRDRNWLWREYLQKGAIDLHTALEVGEQMALEKRIEARIGRALKDGDTDSAIAECSSWLEKKAQTPEMRALHAEELRVGEESNALFGVISDAAYNLDHDFIGLGWTRRQLERAKAATGEKRRELLSMISDYTDPGPGGFYDNCGTLGPMPDLSNGYPYDYGQPYVTSMLSESNRLSQRTMCDTQDEKQGVAFHYDGLDPHAHYRIRVTLVRPHFQERYAMRMNQHAESIYANDILVARGVDIPEYMSDYFTFEIPQEATKSGSLTLRFEKMADVADGDRVSVEQWRNSGGFGTIVSEIWLMKDR